MINQAQIRRLAEQGQWSRLLQRVIDNGRPCSPAVQRRLKCPTIAAVTALSLAIQRDLELGYGCRSEEGNRLLARLLTMQGTDGRFGCSDASDDDRIIATCMAVRALMEYFAAPAGVSEPAAVSVGRNRSSVRFSAALALERAATALLQCDAIPGHFGGDAVTAQIVQWQLGSGMAANDASVALVLGRLAQGQFDRDADAITGETDSPMAEAA